MKRPISKATRKQTRVYNSRLVLKTIYGRDTISRADIARATQLTRPTVSDVVADLMESGLVEEVGYGPSAGGKPPILLSVADDSYHLIGIDLASGEFRGAVVNLRGKIKHRLHLPLQGRDGDVALALVYDVIDELVAATDSPLLGIGIGTPGLMDPVNGIVRRAVNLDWNNLPLRSLLQERYNLPVYVANDSQVGALAEHTFGQIKDVENLVVVKIENGIGSGIVLGGRLFYGDAFGAGEIGHITVVENGERCRCGNLGCLETVLSGRAIVQRAQAIARDNPDSPLHQFVSSSDEITIDTVCQASNAGDEAVQQMIEEAGRHLGTVIASLVSVLNIRHILVTGSVTCFGPSWIDVIKQEMSERCLTTLANETEIGISSIGKDIVILGASALVLTYELGLFAPSANEIQYRNGIV
ncbi:MAG: ROK family transcriptional regulator [Chloroflexi bacterium]|nr:ROK family transcriptional regulator [Chloroflexota bacterium]